MIVLCCPRRHFALHDFYEHQLPRHLYFRTEYSVLFEIFVPLDQLFNRILYADYQVIFTDFPSFTLWLYPVHLKQVVYRSETHSQKYPNLGTGNYSRRPTVLGHINIVQMEMPVSQKLIQRRKINSADTDIWEETVPEETGTLIQAPPRSHLARC